MKNEFLHSARVRLYLLSIVLSITSSVNKSIAQTYTFSTFTAPYAELTNDILLTGNLVWLNFTQTIPLGFNFQIDSTVFNEVKLQWDADIQTPDGLSEKYILWPMASDIADIAFNPPNLDEGQPGSISQISYKTEGAVGSRICKIQWKNIGFFYDFLDDNQFTDTVNFQVWLYEADKSIEYRYGPSLITEAYPIMTLMGGITVGFASWDSLNQDWIRQFINGSVFSPSLDTCPTNTCPGITDTLPDGTVFRFAPPIPNAISNSPETQTLQVFPNPTTGILNIANIALGKIKLIEIWNTIGQKSLELKPNTKLDISDLGPGIYSIRVITDEGVYVTKIQKQ